MNFFRITQEVVYFCLLLRLLYILYKDYLLPALEDSVLQFKQSMQGLVATLKQLKKSNDNKKEELANLEIDLSEFSNKIIAWKKQLSKNKLKSEEEHKKLVHQEVLRIQKSVEGFASQKKLIQNVKNSVLGVKDAFSHQLDEKTAARVLSSMISKGKILKKAKLKNRGENVT